MRPYTEYLRAAGYYTTNNSKTDYQFKSPITAWDENGRDAHWKNRPEGMPFFSIFNSTTTHESQVWDRTNDPVVIPPERVLLPPYYPDTLKVRWDVARVYSNVAVMDREVGELLAELEEAGLADDTIVIWYSDHGGPLPRQKRLILDSGLHVPFIMRFPGGAHAGTVNDDLASFVDIPATILSLAGVKVPEYMQGRPFWGEQKAPPREYIYAARDRLDAQYDASRAVRDKRFKYIRNFKPEGSAYLDVQYRTQMGIMQELLRMRDEGTLDPVQARWFRQPMEPEELYDTVADPHEVHDLARDPAYAGVVERMSGALDEWLERIGDDPLRPETELVESMWPGGVQPKTAAPGRLVDGRQSRDRVPHRGRGHRLPGRRPWLRPRPLAPLHRPLRGPLGKHHQRHRHPRRLHPERHRRVRGALDHPGPRGCSRTTRTGKPGSMPAASKAFFTRRRSSRRTGNMRSGCVFSMSLMTTPDSVNLSTPSIWGSSTISSAHSGSALSPRATSRRSAMTRSTSSPGPTGMSTRARAQS